MLRKPDTFISGEDVPPEKAQRFWSEALNKAGVPGQAKIFNSNPFSGSITQYELGQTKLNFLKASAAGRFIRTRQDCAQLYALVFATKGPFKFEQGGKEVLVNEGNCTLSNLAEPKSFYVPEDANGTVSLIIPSQYIKNWIPHPQDATAILLSKHSKWGNALAASMSALDPSSLDKLAVTPQAVAEHICCMLALALGPSGQRIHNHKASTLHRLRQQLRKHSCDPDFSPNVLAFEQGISRQALDFTFASAGTSFRSELMALRMEQACQFLEDSSFDKKSIVEIARLVGFVNASHFAARFKKLFGVPPSLYRSIRRS